MCPQSARLSPAEENVLEVHFELNWWFEIGQLVGPCPPLCSGAGLCHGESALLLGWSCSS